MKEKYLINVLHADLDNDLKDALLLAPNNCRNCKYCLINFCLKPTCNVTNVEFDLIGVENADICELKVVLSD